jgi:hypothetical protein
MVTLGKILLNIMPLSNQSGQSQMQKDERITGNDVSYGVSLNDLLHCHDSNALFVNKLKILILDVLNEYDKQYPPDNNMFLNRENIINIYKFVNEAQDQTSFGKYGTNWLNYLISQFKLQYKINSF